MGMQKVGSVSGSTARLMAGLWVAAHCPTNLVKVKAIMQGENESPATFLERLYDAYRQYTP
jgi:hypothetical protein